MKPRKILVVEDEADVRELLAMHLKRDGFDVTAVEDGEVALKLCDEESFALAVVDWMLPGMSGLDFCKKLHGRFPLLMLTARADTADKVLGLELGADDYLTKPFEIPELLARVRALLRRAEAGPKKPQGTRITHGKVTLDTTAHKAWLGKAEIELTLGEFKLLRALIDHAGEALSRETLISKVQGPGVAVVDRTVDTLLVGLRKKLGSFGNHIETVRGVGYRMKSDV